MYHIHIFIYLKINQDTFLETIIWFNLSILDSLSDLFGLSFPLTMLQSQLIIPLSSIVTYVPICTCCDSFPGVIPDMWIPLTRLNSTMRRSYPFSQFQDVLEIVMPISPVHVHLPNSVHGK